MQAGRSMDCRSWRHNPAVDAMHACSCAENRRHACLAFRPRQGASASSCRQSRISPPLARRRIGSLRPEACAELGESLIKAGSTGSDSRRNSASRAASRARCFRPPASTSPIRSNREPEAAIPQIRGLYPATCDPGYIPISNGLTIERSSSGALRVCAGATRSLACPLAAASRRRSTVSSAERFMPALRSTAASSLPALST